jgi:hypothetical protein
MIASDETITTLSRRAFFATATAARLGGLAIAQSTPVRAAVVNTDFSKLPVYGNGTLPAGICSRQIPNVNAMTASELYSSW